jgi:hypothetical protein
MNDEQLILYYYGDGLERAERNAIEAALDADPLLRRRYDALRRELDGIGDDQTVKAPEHLAARWHDSIDRAAARERVGKERGARSFHLPSFAWGTAIAAALVLGIGIGFYASTGNGPDAPPASGTAVVEVMQPADGAAAFTRGLQVHFQQSRQDIGRLPVDSNGEREMLIMHIIQQNRLFARAANEHGSPELARVLRAFEPVLTQLASENLSPEETARLQAKLAFELNVMLTKLNRAPSNSSESI